jgi:hypothetical protein
MADTVAIISIVSGATVALGGHFINARLENQRIKQQVADARLQELGELLDGSVQHFWAAYRTLFTIREGPEPGDAGWSPDKMRELGYDLEEHVTQVVADALRVGIRTPRNAEITTAHGDANRIIRVYEAKYREYLDYDLVDEKPPPPPPDEALFDAMGDFRQSIRKYVGVVEPQGLQRRRWPASWPGSLGWRR